MGLSASQARFLQLTARRSNIEFEAQQINFQRIQWSDKLAAASSKYQEATMNRQMVFSFNTGSEVTKVPLSYTNYKNYMNQQLEGVSTSQDKYYLVSSSGNKIVVSSKEEMEQMIEEGTKRTSVASIEKAREDIKTYNEGMNNPDLSEEEKLQLPIITPYTQALANMDLDNATIQTIVDENGNEADYVIESQFSESDFMIADDLEDVTNFQRAIQDGVYFFAKFKENSETGEKELRTEQWDVLGGGAISEEYDKTDDAKAEAEYKAVQDKVQMVDKKLEMRLDQLESERSAIQTEMESVSKVIEDNIEKSFKTFG